MGFLKDLFLGTKPRLRVHQADLTSKTQQVGLDALIARLSGSGGRATPFTGQLSAPLGEGELTSLAALEERAKALAIPSENLEAAGGSIRDLLDFRGQTADTEEFFKTNVQDPLLQAFERELLPRISRSFGGNEFFTSERQAAEGLAREDLLEALTGARTATALDAFNQSRNRALQAAGLVPGLEAAEGGRTQSMLDILEAAGLPREVEQAGLDREYQEFVRQITQNEDLMRLLATLVLSPTKENIGQATPGSSGLIAQFLGSLASAGGKAIGGKASDRRLKTDIKLIGMWRDLVPLYSYRYKWETVGTKRVGVMAQDLLTIAPQFVLPLGRFFAVNYAGLAKWLQ